MSTLSNTRRSLLNLLRKVLALVRMMMPSSRTGSMSLLRLPPMELPGSYRTRRIHGFLLRILLSSLTLTCLVGMLKMETLSTCLMMRYFLRLPIIMRLLGPTLERPSSATGPWMDWEPCGHWSWIRRCAKQTFTWLGGTFSWRRPQTCNTPLLYSFVIWGYEKGGGACKYWHHVCIYHYGIGNLSCVQARHKDRCGHKGGKRRWCTAHEVEREPGHGASGPTQTVCPLVQYIQK